MNLWIGHYYPHYQGGNNLQIYTFELQVSDVDNEVIASLELRDPLYMNMLAQSLNRFCLFATPWSVALQAHLSMGWQEYCSGLPFPSPGDLLTQWSNPCLLHWQADSLPLSHQRSPLHLFLYSSLLSLPVPPQANLSAFVFLFIKTYWTSKTFQVGSLCVI